MMHLVATNLIVWIQGILKETIEEIFEHEKDVQGGKMVNLDSRMVKL